MEAFSVSLDTGSDKLIIMSTSCIDCIETFNSSQSTTFIPSNQVDSISYLDGSYVVGYKVADQVSFDEAGVFAVRNFNFLLGHS